MILFSDVIHCKCEMKKAAALILEKCKEINNDVIQNKTVTLIKKIENCRPFISASILLLCISIILIGIIIYFYLKPRENNSLPY